MSTLSEILAANPPRLEVEYNLKDDGQEQFGWRLIGNGGMPFMTLIGFVSRVQTQLGTDCPNNERCDERKLVIAQTAAGFSWFCGDDIPRDPLLGFLELVKQTLITAHVHQQQQQQQQQKPGLFGPDGQRWRR